MPNRRDFVKKAASVTAGLLVGGGPLDAAIRSFQAGTTPRRRTVSVGGRRVRTVDVHAHCAIPEVLEVVKGSKIAPVLEALLSSKPQVLGPDRLRAMDEQGVDVEALSIIHLVRAERAMAREIISRAERKAGGWCAAIPIASGPESVAYRTTWRPISWTTPSRSWACAVLPSVVASKARKCRRASSTHSGPRQKSWGRWCSCIPSLLPVPR